MHRADINLVNAEGRLSTPLLSIKTGLHIHTTRPVPPWAPPAGGVCRFPALHLIYLFAISLLLPSIFTVLARLLSRWSW